MSKEETQVEKNEETSSEETTTTEELEVEEESTEEEDSTEEQVSKPKSKIELRLEELSDDNRRQKELLDQIMILGMGGNNNQGVVTQDTDDKDDTELDPAVAKKLNKIQRQLTQQSQGMLGGVLEEMDKTAILSSPQALLYKKYQQEVESYRKQMFAQGRFFKRGEALANLLLDKGLLGTDKPKSKKIVKTVVKPAGETQKAASLQSKDKKPQTSKERLAGKSF